MGAIALNGASNDVTDPDDRTRTAARGWARWAPVSAAAIGAHLLGGSDCSSPTGPRLTRRAADSTGRTPIFS
ncbi:hypothetical protein [Dactylosporangium sp. NPDC051484]|uniref:hypothetical protein n=1 Tax=Dactylosporangium sp. NPDC051484 TaxID=3154942 RepID=UPI00344FEAF1